MEFSYRSGCFALLALIAALQIVSLVNPKVTQAPDNTGETSQEGGGDSLLEYGVYTVLLGAFCLFLRDFSSFVQKELTQCRETQSRTGADFITSDYIWYRIDYLCSDSKNFKIYALMSCTVLLIFVAGMFFTVVSGLGLSESMWLTWTFVADPGTHADQSGWIVRLLSMITTLGGMLIFAMSIGFVSEEISSFVDNLKKGKSRVVESGHTLIIGQGDKLMPTIQQVAYANESENGGLIVILTILPKEELEDVILGSRLDLRGTVIIVRSGSPHSHTDLRRVCAQTSRSIIVLADRSVSNPDMADVYTVRTILSLRGLAAPRVGAHIVCEVCDIDNEELLTLVGKDHVETIVSHDIVGRLMIQCARVRGLSHVLDSLMGYEGSEFYLSEWPELVGNSFGEVSCMFPTAVVIGIFHHEDSQYCKNQQKLVDSVVNGDMSVMLKGEYGYSDIPMISPDGDPSPKHQKSLFPNASLEHSNSFDHDKEKLSNHHNKRTVDSNFELSGEDLPWYISPCGASIRGLELTGSTSTLPGVTNNMRMELNPRDDVVLEAGDMLVVIAEDNDTYSPVEVNGSTLSNTDVSYESHSSTDERVEPSATSVTAPVNANSSFIDVQRMNIASSLSQHSPIHSRPEKMLFVGWRRDMDDMILQVEDYVAPNSELTLYSQLPVCEREMRLVDGGLDVSKLVNVSLTHLEGSTTSRADLEYMQLETYDSILILADEDLESSSTHADMIYADSKSLTCLLLIRDIQEKLARKASLWKERGINVSSSNETTPAVPPMIIPPSDTWRDSMRKAAATPEVGNTLGEEGIPLRSDGDRSSIPTNSTNLLVGTLTPTATNTGRDNILKDLTNCVDDCEIIDINAVSIKESNSSPSEATTHRPPSSTTSSTRSYNRRSGGQGTSWSTPKVRHNSKVSDGQCSIGKPSSFSYQPAISKHSKRHRHTSLISEILDLSTKSVISAALKSDFVLSNELVSMTIAMVSEQREVNCILKELFSGKGNEILIRPADEYVLVGAKATFLEVMCIARQKREIAIGYRVDDKDIIINPEPKSDVIDWHENIEIIVISQKGHNKRK